MSEKTIKALAAMLCLTTLETVALIKGIDGALFMPVVATIAGLGGYVIGHRNQK